MSAGFTKGPWSAHGNGWEVRACDGQMKVCDIRGWGYLTGGGALNLPENEATEIQKANERLIAQAPDLYRWLETAIDDYEQHYGIVKSPSHWTQQGKVALAKVRRAARTA